MAGGRANACSTLILVALAIACSAESLQKPAAEPGARPRAVPNGADDAPGPGLAPGTPAGCPVQAATSQLCFSTKEEACESMGCSAERCTYLYGGSGASVVACDD